MSGEKTRPDTDGLAWFKSSYSAGDGGQCVEVATGSGVLHVRDSKDEAGPIVSLAPEAWEEFVGFAAWHTV
ncbi:DUF397 domain-containing protein [Streptomyces poonensis]|uniref:DUF397 domain-containing protein n=1 Tax=Streptomyces poonensis TaxID=68255 RepID=A0A918Q4R2_9ACTN|nr:DUF397 domain-containing protein [Streptomyces poonensis]GGZ30773.1 hypothetical protein GCM10010365_59080 [Streptomyces poonensis]GLJ88233.1 hypothetical protein GCM10017589_08330 [Streptomyces poonensis]